MALTNATLELLVQLKDQASSGLSSLGGALSSLGGIAGGVALAGVAAFGAAVVAGVGDAQQSAQLLAQTQNVITSTGAAAGVSAQHVVDYATALSDASGKSLFGDDQIQQSENLLLTFTNIKGASLDAATAMSVDLAQALGGAPKDQAILLGKALNDPAAGLSALSRNGVTFSDQQKEQIKTMQAAGDVAGAQAVIMAELNKEFGGSAAAAAAATGGWSEFKGRLGEAAETLGAALLPAIGKVGGLLLDTVVPVVESLANGFAVLVGGLNDTSGASDMLSGILGTLTPIFNDIYAAAQEVFGTLIEQGGPILNDLGKIAMPALTAAGQILASLWDNVLKPALMANWYIFKTYLLPAIGEVIHVLSVVLPPVIQFLASIFTTVLLPTIHLVIDAISFIGKGIEDVIGWFTKLSNSIGSITIPSWLQGHSPPPLANWFTDIATSANAAGGAVDAVAPVAGGALPSLPALASSSSGGGGVVINVTVQGHVTTERDLVLAIRDSMNQLGRRNVSIFASDVTP